MSEVYYYRIKICSLFVRYAKNSASSCSFKRIVDDAVKPLGMALERVAKINGQAPVAENKSQAFMDLVYTYAEKNNVPLDQAMSAVTGSNPDLGRAYQAAMRAGSQVQAKAAAAHPFMNGVATQHEFVDVVYAHAKATGKPIEIAVAECTRSHPALAKDYLSSMRRPNRAETID
jgi:hypothetical protein